MHGFAPLWATLDQPDQAKMSSILSELLVPLLKHDATVPMLSQSPTPGIETAVSSPGSMHREDTQAKSKRLACAYICVYRNSELEKLLSLRPGTKTHGESIGFSEYQTLIIKFCIVLDSTDSSRNKIGKQLTGSSSDTKSIPTFEEERKLFFEREAAVESLVNIAAALGDAVLGTMICATSCLAEPTLDMNYTEFDSSMNATHTSLLDVLDLCKQKVCSEVKEAESPDIGFVKEVLHILLVFLK